MIKYYPSHLGHLPISIESPQLKLPANWLEASGSGRYNPAATFILAAGWQ